MRQEPNAWAGRILGQRRFRMGWVSMLRTMIVDDEPYARADLRSMLETIDGVQSIWEAESVPEARRLLERYVPDLLFLDVQMPGYSGFSVLTAIDERTHVVFVSAYVDYAIRAFEVGALDYILKPVARERLERSIARMRRRRGEALVPPANEQICPDDCLRMKRGRESEMVPLTDVVAVTSLGGNYTQVHRVDGETLDVRRTIKEWESALPKDSYLRVHRGAIINLRHLQQTTQRRGAGPCVHLKSLAEPIPISRRYWRELDGRLEVLAAPVSARGSAGGRAGQRRRS